jgi:hypothetical protein
MNQAHLEKKKKELGAQLTTVRKTTDELSSKIINADGQELRNLRDEKLRLEGQDKSLLAEIGAIDFAISQAKIAERHKVELAERERKEGLIEWLKQNPPNCPSCDAPGSLVESIRQPTVFGSGMGDKAARWCLDYQCTNDSMAHGMHRFKIWPDEDLEVIENEVKARTPTVKCKGSTNQAITIDRASTATSRKEK